MNLVSGYLENVNITINRNKETKENIFIIIPSGRDLQQKLEQQIRTSWNFAVEYVRRIVKIEKINYYKVIIELSRRNADYTGSSLGITLTLRFIEEILKFHNSKKIITAKSEIAFSGAMDKNGKIEKLSPEILKDKIETVFYSDKDIFVIPPVEIALINDKLEKLQEIYPNRNLEIINLDSVGEILNRRNLTEIQKLPLVIRAKNHVSKNLLTFGIILSVAAAIILTAIFIREIDTNPAEFQNIENNLNVLNSHGKILWNKKLGYNPQEAGLKVTQQLVDIDEDGINEVLLGMLDSETSDAPQQNIIALYNSSGDRLWSYHFSQNKIPNDFEDYSYTFSAFLLGITTEGNNKVLYCFANNSPSFPSIIFKLDALTGKEIGERFWHPGHVLGGLIYDFNKDGVEELVVWAVNNGLGRCVMFSINPTMLVGKAPGIQRYDFYGIDPANFNFYLLLPKTDYDDYVNNRSNHVPRGSMVRLSDQEIYFPLNFLLPPGSQQEFCNSCEFRNRCF